VLYTPDMLSLLRLRSGLCVCTIWSFGLTSIRDLKRRYNDFLRDINDWIIHLVMLQSDSWDILFGLVLVELRLLSGVFVVTFAGHQLLPGSGRRAFFRWRPFPHLGRLPAPRIDCECRLFPQLERPTLFSASIGCSFFFVETRCTTSPTAALVLFACCELHNPE
jgi:hypothetical protein